MPRGNYTIQRSCEECGKIFTPPTYIVHTLVSRSSGKIFNNITIVIIAMSKANPNSIAM